MTDCAECSMTTQRHCSRGERDSAAAAADGSRDRLATPPRRSLLLLLRADSHGTPCDACARYIAYAAAVRVTDYMSGMWRCVVSHSHTRAMRTLLDQSISQSIVHF